MNHDAMTEQAKQDVANETASRRLQGRSPGRFPAWFVEGFAGRLRQGHENVVKALGLGFPFELGKRSLVRSYVRRRIATAFDEAPDRRIVTRDGLAWALDLTEEIDLWVYLTGWWEKTDFLAALRTLKPEDTVIDVGANIGVFALRAARAVGRAGRVVAFEPNPDTFDRLASNIRLNDLVNVEAVEGALADKTGELELFLPTRGSAGGASLFEEWLSTAGIVPSQKGSSLGTETGLANRARDRHTTVDDHRVTVPVGTLDAYCQQSRLKRVQFLKIDVEGAEPFVLLGGQDLIARDRPRMLIECNPTALAAAGWNAADFLALIRDLGYRAFSRRPRGMRLQPLTTASDLNPKYTNVYCVPA